jgi:sulfide:quinone oxidoreductase
MTAAAPLRVLVAGGGVAGLEALLALRALAGPRCDVTLLAPGEDFVYRPAAVGEPFARGWAQRHPLREIAADLGATFVQAGLAGVDGDARVAETSEGERLRYDALLLAVGAQPVHPYARTLQWDDGAPVERLAGLVRDIEGGWVRRVAVVIPPGPGWPLPAYEIAILTARQAWGMGAELELTLVTPEPGPVARFGPRASSAIRGELADAGVRLETGAYAQVEAGSAMRVALRPSGRILEVDRVVSLPVLQGRPIPGVPAGPGGFVTVDRLGAVTGLPRVWAAGDGIDFPVKFGGLAAAQADAAASAIAALADPTVQPRPFRPVLRGRLLTGRTEHWMRFDGAGGRGEGVVSQKPLWWPPGKLAGRFLAPYLAAREAGGTGALSHLPEAGGLPVQVDLERQILLPVA